MGVWVAQDDTRNWPTRLTQPTASSQTRWKSTFNSCRLIILALPTILRMKFIYAAAGKWLWVISIHLVQFFKWFSLLVLTLCPPVVHIWEYKGYPGHKQTMERLAKDPVSFWKRTSVNRDNWWHLKGLCTIRQGSPTFINLSWEQYDARVFFLEDFTTSNDKWHLWAT